MAFITFTLVTSQSYCILLLFCFAAVSFYGEDYLLPFKHRLTAHRSPFQYPLLLLLKSTHICLTPFSWFPFITSSVLTRYHSCIFHKICPSVISVFSLLHYSNSYLNFYQQYLLATSLCSKCPTKIYVSISEIWRFFTSYNLVKIAWMTPTL